jgi:hypothetical protein
MQTAHTYAIAAYQSVDSLIHVAYYYSVIIMLWCNIGGSGAPQAKMGFYPTLLRPKPCPYVTRSEFSVLATQCALQRQQFPAGYAKTSCFCPSSLVDILGALRVLTYCDDP